MATTQYLQLFPYTGQYPAPGSELYVSPILVDYDTGDLSGIGDITLGNDIIGTTGLSLISSAGNITLTPFTGIVDFNNSSIIDLTKLSIVTGANASIGTTAAMTAGTITVSTNQVTASSKIFLVHAVPGGTLGALSYGTIVAGTSFVITSSSNTDTSTVTYLIIN
jgi:hypothetical protein